MVTASQLIKLHLLRFALGAALGGMTITAATAIKILVSSGWNPNLLETVVAQVFGFIFIIGTEVALFGMPVLAAVKWFGAPPAFYAHRYTVALGFSSIALPVALANVRWPNQVEINPSDGVIYFALAPILSMLYGLVFTGAYIVISKTKGIHS